MAEVRGPVGDLVCKLHVQIDAALVGDGRQMEHGVRRAPKGHVDGEGVLEGLLGHDVSRADVVLEAVHDLIACFFCKADSCAVDRGDRAVAAKAHADRFGQAVHGVCGVHAGAGAAGRADVLLEVCKVLCRDLSGIVGADRLKHGA